MLCDRTCTPSANRRPPTTSTPNYSVVPNASGGGISNTVKKTVDAVLQLLEQGTPLKQITRRLSLARQTVRRIARGGGLEVFRSRVSILEPYAETLDALWTGGRRNGAELWRRLRIRGFQGSLRVVVEWATRLRLDEVIGAGRAGKEDPVGTQDCAAYDNRTGSSTEGSGIDHGQDRARCPTVA